MNISIAFGDQMILDQTITLSHDESTFGGNRLTSELRCPPDEPETDLFTAANRTGMIEGIAIWFAGHPYGYSLSN
jgi:hypothetical protein